MLECAYASHGDTKHILLFPSNPAECFEFAVKAFDLAERFQTPVIMLSDLDIGMNDWVVPRLTWDDSLSPRSRPRADARRSREDSRLPALQRRGRKSRGGAHASRRASARARFSRADRATTSSAATPKLPTNIRKSSTGCCASTKPRHDSSRRRRSANARARSSAWSRSAVATRRCAKPSISSPRQGIHGGLHARARIPLRRRRRGVPRASTNSALWWSRIAMRNYASLFLLETPVAEGSAALHPGVRRISAERPARCRSRSRVQLREARMPSIAKPS